MISLSSPPPSPTGVAKPMPRTVYFCSLDCGRHFKYSAACARHEMNGKCQRATPVALPEPSQKRNRKRTLQEAMDLADEFDASPLGKKRFAKEKGISVGCLRRCYDRREAHKDQPQTHAHILAHNLWVWHGLLQSVDTPRAVNFFLA